VSAIVAQLAEIRAQMTEASKRLEVVEDYAAHGHVHHEDIKAVLDAVVDVRIDVERLHQHARQLAKKRMRSS